MSKIWAFMIAFSMIISLIMGNPGAVISDIMEYSKVSIQNIIELTGMMCFWSGIFNIFENTSAIEKFSNFFNKFIFKIFDNKKLTKKAKEYMSLNIVTNIVGIGNAATINGINAMKEMQNENKDKEKPSDNMTTFVLINTASLQLIPTNMIALRAMYGSTNPSSIIVPVWIVTMLSLIVGITSIKILNKKMR